MNGSGPYPAFEKITLAFIQNHVWFLPESRVVFLKSRRGFFENHVCFLKHSTFTYNLISVTLSFVVFLKLAGTRNSNRNDANETRRRRGIAGTKEQALNNKLFQIIKE
jgi:hypothetical protein